MEIGVLLSESLNNSESWRSFLKEMQIPDAELLAKENLDSAFSRGGNAAGNLLWLFQSLGRTYSQIKELIKVYPFSII